MTTHAKQLGIPPCNIREYPISAALGFGYPLLCDASPRDRHWDRLKKKGYQVAQMFEGAAEEYPDYDLESWAIRIRNCCQTMKFRRTDKGLKLQRANFCRVRLCPICVSRKSDIWQAKALQNLPRILRDFPNTSYRFLFLTLTVRNCPVENVRETIKKMNSGFQELTGSNHKDSNLSKSWPGIGYIKTVEVTRSKNRWAHPHIHAVVLVKSSYFASKKYLNHWKWSENWKKALKVDYQPVTDVRAIPIKEEKKALIEVLKYEIKPEDFKRDYKWLSTYAKQVKNLRFISAGGELRNYFRFLESNPNMIHALDKDNGANGNQYMSFSWDSNYKDYIATSL